MFNCEEVTHFPRRTYMAEIIQNDSRAGIVHEIFDIIGLTFLYIFRHNTVQRVLATLAFLTFGIGDGLTGAMLMETRGIGAESNFIAQRIFATSGFTGMILGKIFITMVILTVVFAFYTLSNRRNYWMTNGFLAALTAGGLMAINANLSAITGIPFSSPAEIISIYLSMVLIFTEAGELIDRHMEKQMHNG